MQGLFFNGNIEDNYLGHILAEIYKDKLYYPYLYGKSGLTILDIGANIGLTSYHFSRFAKQVYALEPAKEHFEVLTHMLEFNKITNVKPINKAIYIENSKFPLYHTPNRTAYSLHSANSMELGSEEVVTITLDKLFEDESIEHVDLMKLDIEGSEVEVLSSEGFNKVADKIDLIIGETHSWSGRNPNQIIEALRLNNFSYEILPADATVFIAKRKHD